MAEVVLDTGDPVLLEYGLTANYTLHLYTNDLDPATTNVIGDFTECTDGDYSSVTLTGGSWTVTTESNKGKGSYAQQEFTLSGAAPAIYGWYLSRSGVGIAAGRLSPTYPAGGGTLRIAPVVRSNNVAA
jgi:hypothetical protein